MEGSGHTYASKTDPTSRQKTILQIRLCRMKEEAALYRVRQFVHWPLYCLFSGSDLFGGGIVPSTLWRCQGWNVESTALPTKLWLGPNLLPCEFHPSLFVTITSLGLSYRCTSSWKWSYILAQSAASKRMRSSWPQGSVWCKIPFLSTSWNLYPSFSTSKWSYSR